MEKGGNFRENYEISVETGKTRRKDGSEDFDDKRVNLTPTVDSGIRTRISRLGKAR